MTSAALKLRLDRPVRKTGQTDIVHTCSIGVISCTNERIVNRTVLSPSVTVPVPSIDKTRVTMATSSGLSDVVLIIVTY